jgi:hypothetical protein
MIQEKGLFTGSTCAVADTENQTCNPADQYNMGLCEMVQNLQRPTFSYLCRIPVKGSFHEDIAPQSATES